MKLLCKVMGCGRSKPNNAKHLVPNNDHHGNHDRDIYDKKRARSDMTGEHALLVINVFFSSAVNFRSTEVLLRGSGRRLFVHLHGHVS